MRAVLWVVSVVVTLAIVIGMGRSWAESKEKRTEPPRTRIGFINLTYVAKNYDKYKNYQEEIKEMIVGFQNREAELRARLKDLRDKAKHLPLVPAKGEKDIAKTSADLEKGKKIQRELEENNKRAKEKIGTRIDQQKRILYLDVAQAAQRYATAHDFDLILHYNDAITKEDYVSTKNITRKLNENAFMPLYWKPSMDISMDLVAVLNRNLRRK